MSDAGEAVSAEALMVPVTVASAVPLAFRESVNALAPAATPEQVGALKVNVTPDVELPELRVAVDGLKTRPAGNGVAVVTTIVLVEVRAVTGLTTTVAVAALPQYNATPVAGDGVSRLAACRKPGKKANPSSASDFVIFVMLSFIKILWEICQRLLPQAASLGGSLEYLSRVERDYL